MELTSRIDGTHLHLCLMHICSTLSGMYKKGSMRKRLLRPQGHPQRAHTRREGSLPLKRSHPSLHNDTILQPASLDRDAVVIESLVREGSENCIGALFTRWARARLGYER